MAAGFQCSKNTLLGLNILYVAVAFLLIGVATYWKSAAVITSLPLLGGIVASGVFLLFVAVLGLLATLKHHQILLFVYMIVLFGIFIIQFSVSCAAIGIDEDQEMKTIETVYKKLDTQGVIDAQKILHCCDWAIEDQSNATATTCKKTIGCWDTQASRALCPSCQSTIKEVVNSGFNGSGGVGLFFAFTEILGAVLAYRYRNLPNPYLRPASATLFAD